VRGPCIGEFNMVRAGTGVEERRRMYERRNEGRGREEGRRSELTFLSETDSSPPRSIPCSRSRSQLALDYSTQPYRDTFPSGSVGGRPVVWRERVRG
jgi:hypothetical protein